MAWNRPNGKRVEMEKRGGQRNVYLKGLVAGAVAIALFGLVLFLVLSADEGAHETKERKSKAMKTVRSSKSANGEESVKLREYRKSINEKLKPFIKASPTNKIDLSEFGLDPNDPDNAMKTSVAQDVASLLAIRPGEPVPEVLVFNFMFEEVGAEMAVATGQKVVTSDGGNKDFLDALKKWKVTIKETDGEARRIAKENLVNAQLELLNGIAEGITVNDSIRAAYTYRVNAAKARNAIIDTIAELHEPDADPEVTNELIRRANEKMAAEGLLEIDAVEVGERYEELQEEAKMKAEKGEMEI